MTTLRSGELDAHLARTLAPVYALHGDEPLLALEAADAVRAAARRAGFSERQVLEPARGFDWSEFTHAAASQSLFAEKTFIDLRLPGGKPGIDGAAALEAYCADPGPDRLLLVSLPRLDRAGQASAWFAALARIGVAVDVYPVERSRLPAWIATRLARQKQSAPPEVLEVIADRVEGNLLAAHQEVQKLGLLAPEGPLSMDVAIEAIAEVARYDPYLAAEALLAGDTARYLRVIDGLRAEGEQPTFVLFAISSALFALQGGGRLFNRRLQAAVEAAARRFSRAQIDDALAQSAAIDRAIKGVGSGDAWGRFMTLGLKLAHGSKA
jgi:DNA polymerase-3 subunit delta